MATDPAYRAYRAKHSRESWQKRRREVIEGYGAKCNCCGEAEYGFLTLDHVHNNGHEKRQKYRGNRQAYYDAIKRGFPPEYQVLCYNCNCAKGFLGACPHRGPGTKVKRKPK